MRRVTDFIVKRRNFIVVLFIIFSVISIIVSRKVNINYKMTEYMPADSETRQGLDIMNQEFKQEDESVLNVMFKNLSEEEKDEVYEKLASMQEISSIDYEKDSEKYNKDENTLYILKVDDKEDSEIAKKVYDFVENNFEDYEYYTSGSIAVRNMDILPMWIIVLAVSICALILIIMCESYIEPFLFLACIGIAVLLNSGTNLIFGTVSHVTNSISAILQLALSMDYSIMLITRYQQEKENNPDKIDAMKEALYKSFSSISSSSVTTIVGLVTLVFMSFTIGRDLGLVLAKGVLLSLLVIFTCLPAFILMFDKLITKTKKRTPNIHLNKLGKFAYCAKVFGFIVLIGLFVAGYILKGNLEILYTASEIDKVGEVFPKNNQIAIIYSKTAEDKIKEYLPELENEEKVDEVLAYGNTIGQKLKYDEFNQKLEDLEVDTQIDEYLLKILYYKYFNEDIQHTMTFDEFINFTKNEVLTNENFSDMLDDDTAKNLDRLEHFSSEKQMNQKRSYREIADILEIAEKDVYNLFVYYYTDKTDITLTIPELIGFINQDVLTDKDYSKNLSPEVKQNLKIISKFGSEEALTKNIKPEDMANLFELDEQSVKDLYLYYYSINGTDNEMTLNEFANFVADEVLTDSNYQKLFDQNLVQSIKQLQMMSNTKLIQKQMSPKEIANLLGMEEDMVSKLMILKNGKQDNGTTMTIKEFIKEIDYLKNHTDYLDGIDVSGILSLKDLANNKSGINQAPLNKQGLMQVFNPMQNGLVAMTYQMAGLPDSYTMTTGDFLNLVITSGNLDEQATAKLKLVKLVIDESTSSTPKEYTGTQIASIFGMKKEEALTIYAIYDASQGNHTTISPYELVTFIIQNKENAQIASNFPKERQNQLQTIFAIMNSSIKQVNYTYPEMAKMMGIDQNATRQIYSLQLSKEGELRLSPKRFVDFLIEHQNDEMLQGKVNANLKTIQKIMNAVISKNSYTANEVSDLLGFEKQDIKLLYSLYSMKYVKQNPKISLKEFVQFILDDVVTNEKYNSQFSSDKVTKLNTICGIMNAVNNKTKYNPEEIFAILSKLTDDVDQDTIDILYIYYGSEKYYQEEWSLTIEELINDIHDNILKDTRFDDFIDDETRNKVEDAKQKIQDSKELLVGKNYARIVLNTVLDSEGEETYHFLQKIYDNLEGEEIYIIGDSPMAYEMSKTFADEFNKISILTIIAIFIVVAITFRSIIIPFILVLIIQCAVYITMGVLSLLGGSIYFIALLIVQSILMGATIDYAILYTSYYRENREKMQVKEAVVESYNHSIHTILTSSSILFIATFLVGSFATDIISKICITLSQGVLCSTLLILLILPAVLALFDRLIIRKK